MKGGKVKRWKSKKRCLKIAPIFPIAIVRNKKTDLYVSKDGAEKRKD